MSEKSEFHDSFSSSNIFVCVRMIGQKVSSSAHRNNKKSKWLMGSGEIVKKYWKREVWWNVRLKKNIDDIACQLNFHAIYSSCPVSKIESSGNGCRL